MLLFQEVFGCCFCESKSKGIRSPYLIILRNFIVLFSNFVLFFNCQTPNLKVEFLSFYLAELSLLDYDCIRFLPSIVAASALFLARFIISPEVRPWVSIYLMDSARCFSQKRKFITVVLRNLKLKNYCRLLP